MSASSGTRRLLADLASIIEKEVIVKLRDGRIYEGVLSGFDHPNMNISLLKAKDNEGNVYHRVIITGLSISEILVKEAPLFDAEEFAEILIKKLNLRPGDVKIYPEAGVVVVLNNIRITEAGVEGSGPIANKVYSIYTEYIEARRRQRGTES